jgi:hypothetical protein
MNWCQASFLERTRASQQTGEFFVRSLPSLSTYMSSWRKDSWFVSEVEVGLTVSRW